MISLTPVPIELISVSCNDEANNYFNNAHKQINYFHEIFSKITIIIYFNHKLKVMENI